MLAGYELLKLTKKRHWSTSKNKHGMSNAFAFSPVNWLEFCLHKQKWYSQSHLTTSQRGHPCAQQHKGQIRKICSIQYGGRNILPVTTGQVVQIYSLWTRTTTRIMERKEYFLFHRSTVHDRNKYTRFYATCWFFYPRIQLQGSLRIKNDIQLRSITKAKNNIWYIYGRAADPKPTNSNFSQQQQNKEPDR